MSAIVSFPLSLSFCLVFLLACDSDDGMGQQVTPPVYADQQLSLTQYTHGLSGVSEGGDHPPAWRFSGDSLFVSVPATYSGVTPFGLESGSYRVHTSQDSIELVLSERPAFSPVDSRDPFVLQVSESDSLVFFTYLDRSTEVFSASFEFL